MLKSLQACRATAAVLVVLYHTSGSIFGASKYFGHKPFGLVFDFGFAGVDFFFVLSGFIMMHVHADDIGKPRALGSYFWKRISRIYPTYWAVLLIILPVFFLAPHLGTGHERDADIIIRSILLYPHPENRMVLVVAWTLVYEVFFYILFGALILDRRLGIALFLAWTAGLLVQPWFENTLSPFVFSNMNLRFLAGIGVALFLARRQMPWPRLVACMGTAVFLLTGMCESHAGPLSPWTQCYGYTIGSALILAGLVQAERSELIRPHAWLVYLGNASYSIYLVHFPALSVIAKLAKGAHLDEYVPSAILFCLHVILAVAVGCLFHQLVERPIHSWARRYFVRTKAPVVSAPAVETTIRKAA